MSGIGESSSETRQRCNLMSAIRRILAREAPLSTDFFLGAGRTLRSLNQHGHFGFWLKFGVAIGEGDLQHF